MQLMKGATGCHPWVRPCRSLQTSTMEHMCLMCAQVLAAAPQARCTVLRGSVDARLAALGEGRVDATLLAVSGRWTHGHARDAVVRCCPSAWEELRSTSGSYQGQRKGGMRDGRARFIATFPALALLLLHSQA